MLRLTLMGGGARVFLCDVTRMARQAREIHHASNTASAALGRLIAGAAIMGANLKSDGDRITVTLSGNGPGSPLCAVAGPNGHVKVTCENPETELPLSAKGKLDVGGFVGREGSLKVIRSYGFGDPYVGQVKLVSGEIAEDFAMYYLESEQIPSLCALGTLVGEDVIASGGILIQAMPECPDSLIDALEIRAELFGAISQLLSEMTLEEIVERCFAGLNPELLEEAPLVLQCDCSRETIEKAIVAMGRDEIEDMIRTEHGCEVTCHFCRHAYRLTQEDLETLLVEAKGENS